MVAVVESDSWVGVDVPGLVRRVRRLADLSQRDLARVVGVSKATVGRWEGGRVEPRLSQLTVILAVVGIRVAALDEVDREVWAMCGSRPDDGAPRDNGGRLYPAHLDLQPDTSVLDIWQEKPRPDRRPRRLAYFHRRRRNRERARTGTPSTQPSVSELHDWLEAVWIWRRHRLRNGRPRDRPIPEHVRPEGLRLLSDS